MLSPIKLVEELLEKLPLLPFKALESKFSSPAEMSGVYTEGMSAAQSFLSLCEEIDRTMRAYANLVKADAKKLDDILEGFKSSDK